VPPEALIALIVVLVPLSWLLLLGIRRGMDHARIRRAVEERGGRVERITRAGALLVDRAREYDVEYVDAEGEPRRRTAVTQAFVGVAWKDPPEG